MSIYYEWREKKQFGQGEVLVIPWSNEYAYEDPFDYGFYTPEALVEFTKSYFEVFEDVCDPDPGDPEWHEWVMVKIETSECGQGSEFA